ncbi:MAG: DUF4270 domain-containing protein [Winogradskyella sp.]|uniref:DUF4270 domain-containing protein n=1 Tax=Winogradskyella sp. TaxID=1883156 RepID=UPI0017A99EF3|nr:DUF4270 domain-containing protein [Winogradskyella sp.]
MKKNKIALQVTVATSMLLSLIACDKDFATLDSDIINEANATNFDILKDSFNVITYTNALGPVQTNNLGLNSLGIYDDAFGRTTSHFLTQLSLPSFDPDFGDEVQIDSVVLTLPFYSAIEEVDDDGNITYSLDSVFGNDPINLRVFESNYFIRDFDPNAEFEEVQAYFSNKSASENEMISEAILEGDELIFVDYNEDTGEFNPIDNTIEISNQGYILTEPDNEEDEDTEPQVLFRQPPGIRVLLDTTFWRQKIIDKEGTSVLSSSNTFSEYLRGLYFKVEPNANNSGSFLLLNTGDQNANITIYYTRLTAITTDDDDTREEAVFTFNFGQNTVNFFENDFSNIALNNGDEINGDSRIYLKGGEGAIANINLFNGEDLDDDDNTLNTFEAWKNEFVETDANGNFLKSKRLVNEANLIFYVDQDIINANEPDRIYLYDADNNTPLVDYFLDAVNNNIPSLSILSHLGPLERVNDEPDGQGIKYKLKITEHINNLLLRDSTNVKLGLGVSVNVNLEEFLAQREVLSSDPDATAPVSSIISPRGTVLYGSNIPDNDINADKKVRLEIYYTEPNN